jgi:hypothetical protein
VSLYKPREKFPGNISYLGWKCTYLADTMPDLPKSATIVSLRDARKRQDKAQLSQGKVALTARNTLFALKKSFEQQKI